MPNRFVVAAVDAARFDVFDCGLISFELGFEVAAYARNQFEQRIVAAGRALSFFAWHLDTHGVGKAFNRIHKVHVVMLHEKTNCRPVRAAAKAVVETFVRTHRK